MNGPACAFDDAHSQFESERLESYWRPRWQTAEGGMRPIPGSHVVGEIFPITDCGSISKLASEPVWIEVEFPIHNVTVVAKPFSPVR